MKAIGKYIVIKPINFKLQKTKGGLLLSESEKEDIRYRQAKIKSVGCDVKGLENGDKIYYDKSAGFKIEIKEESYKVIQEKDVVIVL
tara:strand:+ start:531 stop:791 length:261 start_codon:yes stop_codon:yes gene_type:complete